MGEPSVAVGGSYAEHDTDMAYGPGCGASVPVRVRHVSAGTRVRHPLGDPNGNGTVLDGRGGLVVSKVEHLSFDDTYVSNEQREAMDAASRQNHVMPSAQLSFGPRRGHASLTGGLGVHSIATVENGALTTKLVPLPALEFDARGAEGMRFNIGFGIPPETGLAPRHAGYWRFGYVFRDGPDLGLGVTALLPPGGLDTQVATTLTASLPLLPSLSLGTFGMLGPAVGVKHPETEQRPLGWRAGGNLTFYYAGRDVD